MPRAEAGTPKAIANKQKSKGLQRLRWYCQVCEKQCRDENGFKCHAQSEAHLRQMLVVGENAGRHISNFSMEFQSAFVQLLSRRFGTKRVLANRVYQEYIADKNHLHMNSTRWVTLTEFCKHLSRAGIARVDETEKGWFISWIDNSPKALAKQEASLKKERLTTSDEQRERMLIKEQIERAAVQENDKGEGPSSFSSSTTPPAVSVEEGLKREEGAEKLKLSFGAKPSVPAEAAPVPTVIKMNALKPNPLKVSAGAGVNPLKRAANPLKAASASSTKEVAGQKRPLSAAEKLILEDQERKRRRVERDGGV